MKFAISRVLVISIVSILGLFVAGLMLRMGGLSSVYAPPHHPFLELKNPIVALGGDEDFAPANSLPALQHVQDLTGTMVLGMDVQRTRDGQWILTKDYAPVELKEWSDLQKLDIGGTTGPWAGKALHLLTLNEALQKFPRQILYLNVLTRYPDQMSSLVKVLDPDNRENRFIIQSPFATVMREVRKLRPLWLFGMDPSSIIRFLFMTSIYLEPITDLNADLFVSPLEIGQKNIFTQRVLDEIARRKKQILVEDPPSWSSVPKDLQRQIFGIVTRRPARFVLLNL